MSEAQPINATTIARALDQISAELRSSPQFLHEALSRRLGRPVVVKVETVNPLGSFKGRGAWLAVGGLAGDGRLTPEREVVAASSGNFGLAVAYAARAFEVPAVIFAAQAANLRKVERIRGLGARVELTGHDFDAAREASQEHAQRGGGLLLVDAEEPRITIGAGTIGVELSAAVERDELPAIGTAFVPVGNGALIVGVGCWLRHASPPTRVVGVQAAGAPSMTLSWRAGRPIETEAADTYAGGIATRVPVPEALELMKDVVDEMLLFSDDELREAQRELTEALGITVEGSAAASWAAARVAPAGQGAALVLVTGANAELD
ncbi:pyridoxal-phosphate dependent enzyme [soil metagenome]